MRMILAVEPATGDVISQEDAARMRLPFTTGWDSYLVFNEAGNCIARPTDFADAKRLLN